MKGYGNIGPIESRSSYLVLTSRLLLTWRSKVTACNSWPNSQSECSESHSGRLCTAESDCFGEWRAPGKAGNPRMGPEVQKRPLSGSLLVTECKGPIDICDALRKRGDTFGCHLLCMSSILCRGWILGMMVPPHKPFFFSAKYPTFVKFRKICVTKIQWFFGWEKITKIWKTILKIVTILGNFFLK
jgi:hypothetical protein